MKYKGLTVAEDS